MIRIIDYFGNYLDFDKNFTKFSNLANIICELSPDDVENPVITIDIELTETLRNVLKYLYQVFDSGNNIIDHKYNSEVLELALYLQIDYIIDYYCSDLKRFIPDWTNEILLNSLFRQLPNNYRISGSEALAKVLIKQANETFDAPCGFMHNPTLVIYKHTEPFREGIVLPLGFFGPNKTNRIISRHYSNFYDLSLIDVSNGNIILQPPRHLASECYFLNPNSTVNISDDGTVSIRDASAFEDYVHSGKSASLSATPKDYAEYLDTLISKRLNVWPPNYIAHMPPKYLVPERIYVPIKVSRYLRWLSGKTAFSIGDETMSKFETNMQWSEEYMKCANELNITPLIELMCYKLGKIIGTLALKRRSTTMPNDQLRMIVRSRIITRPECTSTYSWFKDY